MENYLKEYLESEEWLKDLFDHAHDLIQVVHLDGTLMYVNHSWSSVLQYSKKEIEGTSIYSFIDEEDRERYRQYRADVISGIVPDKEISFKLKTKAGNVVHVEGFVSLKVKDGIPVCTRGIFRDVTAKVQSDVQLLRYHEEVKERETNLEQILLNAPDAVIVIDEKSRITFWNPKAEEIFGWTQEEVLNQSLSTIIIPVQYRKAHEEGMKRYLSTGKSHVLNRTIEITALNKWNHEFYISLTISHASHGDKSVFVAFLRNISEQKSNQLDLERKTKELEMTNANLEAFAYAASHDLKEPIRKIHVFSDRLKMRLKDKLEEEDQQLFERMEIAAKRMHLLIEDLLIYSTVSRGASDFEEVDLTQTVQGVLEDLELEIAEKGARIKAGALPVVKGQQRQLQQLFQNLIGNALKYSREDGPPEVKITFKQVEGQDFSLQLPPEKREESYYLVEVRDNGIGFAPDEADRIFNVFTRLYTNTKHKGTGVGLSIARKVVENHNGYIWAEGTPGEGAVFKVLLPAN